jgi:hypothetical protein
MLQDFGLQAKHGREVVGCGFSDHDILLPGEVWLQLKTMAVESFQLMDHLMYVLRQKTGLEYLPSIPHNEYVSPR